ncbi:MAG: penicillin-insensitive murein endopeptidase [Pseudomonadota bacterium]
MFTTKICNKVAKCFVTGLALLVLQEPVFAETPAKRLFGNKPLPASMKAAAHGFYTKGCLAGGVAIPVDGPNWQAMRLSRNRRWGHPDLIRIIEELSYKGKKDGWNGLMVGDISQPRGGPMLTGHRSHQMGLDADIWFNPMPDRRLTYQERENTSAVSVLKRGDVYVDRKRWTPAHTRLLYHAASFPEVERVLVHPGVKKQLCDTVKSDRKWLNKIRPTWGHHFHFHIRIGCPNGSPGCKRQNSTGNSTGCTDGSLDWWFNVALNPDAEKPKQPPKKRPEIVIGDLPRACRVVLSATAPSLHAATHVPLDRSFSAPQIRLPKYSASKVLERGGNGSIEGTAAGLGVSKIPIPTPRPY